MRTARGRDRAGLSRAVDGVHHVEIWVADLAPAEAAWGWLLGRLGWTPYQRFEHGRSWRLGQVYVVVEESPALLRDVPHDRRRAGLNHLALHAESEAVVDALVADAPTHGWTLLFGDRHPHAGGPQHYAAYLEDAAGFEVEVVARA